MLVSEMQGILPLDAKVRIVNATAALNGKTGINLGLGSVASGVGFYIILFDEPLPLVMIEPKKCKHCPEGYWAQEIGSFNCCVCGYGPKPYNPPSLMIETCLETVD